MRESDILIKKDSFGDIAWKCTLNNFDYHEACRIAIDKIAKKYHLNPENIYVDECIDIDGYRWCIK